MQGHRESFEMSRNEMAKIDNFFHEDWRKF